MQGKIIGGSFDILIDRVEKRKRLRRKISALTPRKKKSKFQTIDIAGLASIIRGDSDGRIKDSIDCFHEFELEGANEASHQQTIRDEILFDFEENV